MKSNTLRFVLLLLTACLPAVLAGCSESSAGTGALDAEPEPAAHYREGHGLQLSTEARTFVSFATAEVEARDLGGGAQPAVPAAAVVRTVKGNFVYVANGEWFLRTPVRTGRSGDGWIEVTDGLYEGDVVVAGGARALWLAEIQAVNGGVACADGH